MERIKIKKLLRHIPVDAIMGSKEVEITGITANSKQVAIGNLFVAKKGHSGHGAKYIPDAIAAGASAVLTDLYDPFFPQVTQVIHSDVPSIEALLAKEFYQYASDHLFLIGVTGTNGKTTISYLIQHLLETLGQPCGLIGGVECRIAGHVFSSSLTTPDIITNHKLFYEMKQAQLSACVMEVSSHALEQGRVALVEYDVAIFTNLSHEHLDYHKTMQSYALAKKRLFSSLKAPQESAKPQFAKIAIVNADSPYTEEMIQGCKAQILTYSLEKPSDLKATDICLTENGLQFTLHYLGKTHSIQSSLFGRFNVYNILAAIGAGIARGFDVERITNALSTFSQVPGRMEKVTNTGNFRIFVDHAHKVDALSNALSTLREMTTGKLITVFGCGGDRDQAKRPMMGSIAEKLSDVVIVTSDNPRSEDPEQIIRDILAGFTDSRKACVLLNREEAIVRAIRMAKSGDTILIAGKGHETSQIFAKNTIDFDDRLVAQAACRCL